MATTIIPLPPGAVRASEWEVNGDEITRFFYGQERGRVRMYGIQDHTGPVLSSGLLIRAGLHFDEIPVADVGAYIDDCSAVLDELGALQPD